MSQEYTALAGGRDSPIVKIVVLALWVLPRNSSVIYKIFTIKLYIYYILCLMYKK